LRDCQSNWGIRNCDRAAAPAAAAENDTPIF
jgi:hypothetical protein